MIYVKRKKAKILERTEVEMKTESNKSVDNKDKNRLHKAVILYTKFNLKIKKGKYLSFLYEKILKKHLQT